MRNIQTHRIFRRVVVAVFTMLLADGASLANARNEVTEVPANALIREFLESQDNADAAPANVRSEEAAPQSNHTTRAKVATLLNLSPWQSWVHLFCDQTARPCTVTFFCGQRTGTPVTWDISLPPSRIFSYWPGKTDSVGFAADDFEAALIAAGLTATEARSRTTCTVRSNDAVEARAYTFIAGQLVPVANQAQPPPSPHSTAPPEPRTPTLSSGNYTMDLTVVSCNGLRSGATVTPHFTLVISGSSFSGRFDGLPFFGSESVDPQTSPLVTWHWNGTISGSGRIAGTIRVHNASRTFSGQVHSSRSASGSIAGSCSFNWRIH